MIWRSTQSVCKKASMLCIAASVLLCASSSLALVDDVAAHDRKATYTMPTASYTVALRTYAPSNGTAYAADTAATPDLADALSTTEQMIRDALNVDLTPYKERFARGDWRRYSGYGQYAAVFMDMADALTATAYGAVERCMPILSRDFRSMSVPLGASDTAQLKKMDWKAVAALVYAFGDELPQVLSDSMEVAFVELPGGAQSLRVAFRPLEEIGSMGDVAQQMHVKFAYAYLRTTTDEAGAPVVAQKHVYPDGYLDLVVHPLPGDLIKNCWFDPRDGGKRLHVGADIRSNAKTDILSVTDGVVTHIGTLPVPGNFVVVMDPYGYEYHYYHMYEVTKYVQVGDRVQAGEPIGLVGNTGNSAANHLHLGIISPDYQYVNPYDLFLQAGIEPIRLDN